MRSNASAHTVGETDSFLARCRKIGVSDEVRVEIIDQVAADPSAGDVVQGSGGLRKVRFGGSGGYRLLVAYFDETSPAYLVSILAKNEQANFTTAQIKALAAKIKGIKNDLRARQGL